MYNFEQIGFIPRSIIRTLKRFLKQISLKTDLFVIYEFRVSRYIAIASLQCFFFLIICPWIFQFFVKFLFLNTFFKYKIISTDIFMNFHQQERAFSQIQTFSQKIYFETLLESFEMIHKNQRNPPRLRLASDVKRSRDVPEGPREANCPALVPRSGPQLGKHWGAHRPINRPTLGSFSAVCGTPAADPGGVPSRTDDGAQLGSSPKAKSSARALRLWRSARVPPGQPLHRRVIKQGAPESQVYVYPSRKSALGARPQNLTQLDLQRHPQLASPPSKAGPNSIQRTGLADGPRTGLGARRRNRPTFLQPFASSPKAKCHRGTGQAQWKGRPQRRPPGGLPPKRQAQELPRAVLEVQFPNRGNAFLCPEGPRFIPLPQLHPRGGGNNRPIGKPSVQRFPKGEGQSSGKPSAASPGGRSRPSSRKVADDYWVRFANGPPEGRNKRISGQRASLPYEKLTKPYFGLLHHLKHRFGPEEAEGQSWHSCFLSRLGKAPSRPIHQKALQSLKYTDNGQKALRHGENQLIDGQRITEKDRRLARFLSKSDLSVSLAPKSGTGNNLSSTAAALTPSSFGSPRRLWLANARPLCLLPEPQAHRGKRLVYLCFGPESRSRSQEVLRTPEALSQEFSLSYQDWANSGVLHGPMTTRPSAQIYQIYFLKCANFYNKQSVTIITNWILDLVTLLFFLVLLILLTPQILILKTFCIESLLSLSETTKCFFLIFFLDLLVGFHSSKSWEIFLQFFIEHFGFHIHQNFIAFFISTFPVLLDTIFKYWIFRYLNKISPSTVATYQAMIE